MPTTMLIMRLLVRQHNGAASRTGATVFANSKSVYRVCVRMYVSV